MRFRKNGVPLVTNGERFVVAQQTRRIRFISGRTTIGQLCGGPLFGLAYFTQSDRLALPVVTTAPIPSLKMTDARRPPMTRFKRTGRRLPYGSTVFEPARGLTPFYESVILRVTREATSSDHRGCQHASVREFVDALEPQGQRAL